jgi:hypothetical protein
MLPFSNAPLGDRLRGPYETNSLTSRIRRDRF